MQSGAPHPEEGRQEADPPPIATYLILAIIVALYFWMWRAGGGESARVAREFGGKDNDLIRAGQYWRLITPIFLHGGTLHLFTNALSLYWFGTQLERFYGWRKYLMIFLVAGIAGNLASFWRTPLPSLGASGALFGLIGAGLIFPIRYRSLIPEQARSHILTQLLLITGLNLGLGFSIPQVDNWAHMGGLIGGAFVALFLIPDGLLDRHPGRIRNALLSAGVALSLLLVGAAALAQWRWTNSQTAPIVTTFGSSRSNPWWTVQIPQRWSYTQARGVWHSPEGATLQIADSERNRAVVTTVLLQMAQVNKQNPRALEALLIDGKEARHLTLKQGQRVLEQFLILAEDRQIVLLLTHRLNPSEAAQREFEAIWQSLRILRPSTTGDRNTPNTPPVPL